MLKSSSSAAHELRLSRPDAHNRAQSPATMEALRTSFLPNLSMDSTIVTTAHFCPMCGQQFEGPQQATEHMHLCHGGLSVVSGVGVGGGGGLTSLLAPPQQQQQQQQHVNPGSNGGGPTNAMKIDYPCHNCDEKFSNQHELDEHHRLIHQGPTALLARCPACNFYGISAHTLQDTNEYKCVHCGSLCTAANLNAPPVQQHQPPPPPPPSVSSAHSSTYTQQAASEDSIGALKVNVTNNDTLVVHRQTYQQQQQQQHPQHPHQQHSSSNNEEEGGSSSLKVASAEKVNLPLESKIVTM